MIKNIVFDMGKVLIHYDVPKYLAKAPKEYREVLKQEVFSSVYWVMLDRGSIEAIEAKDAMKSRLPKQCGIWVDEFVDHWHDELDINEEVEILAKEVKENGYKVYLLSNTSLKFHNFRKNIPALKYFDKEFISADWKLLKPEPAIYAAFLKNFELKANECYFIDDNPLNIESALNAGMKGFVFHGDVHKLRKHMRENGIDVRQ